MRDQQKRCSGFAVEREKQVDDRLAGALVKVAGGLIGEQQCRPHHEGPGNGDALLFSAGQLVRVMTLALFQANRAQRLERLLGGTRHSGKLQG
jgi:hypothetical protein